PGAIVPPGFSIIKYADIYRPTSLAFDPNGRLFATSFDGTVHVFTDFDGDGRADQDDIFASGFDTPLGVFARSQPRDVLVSSNGKVTVLRDLDGNNSAESRFDLITGLPTGLHQNNNLKVGPDGWIYMGVGSTCDVCDEPDERSATIMRFDPNSGAGEIVAEGLRNPYDFAFHPQTNAIFATDNGRDDLGVHHPFEELNHIIPGEHYGWPNCWGELNGTDCEGTQQAVGFFEARASANSIEFYTGSEFPPAYQWSAFVTLFGSFETRVQTGVLQIVIRPEGDGYTTQMNWFALWPDARPLGLTQGPDGAIYVGDYLQDVIYRISYGD
ncbi:MAG: PQQ-dependent sugar dehydrogenase, partial [Chloroflexota bacterium]